MLITLRNTVAALIAFMMVSTAAMAQNADIVVMKSGPNTATVGSNVTYTITLTNGGVDPATNVVLNDPIPPGMTFVSSTAEPGFTCTTPAVGADAPPFNCTSPQLNPGATATFTLTLNIPGRTAPGTQFTNVATSSSPDDPTDENNSGTAVTTVPAGSADVLVSKNGPAAGGVDTDVVYTIVVGNAGPDSATSLTLTDVLPGTLQFKSLSQTGTPLACNTPPVDTNGTITCTAATYASGASTTLTLTTHVPAGTPIGTQYTNVATVTTTTADPTANNDTSQTNLFVAGTADLALTKTGAQTVNAGANIVYTITVANNGPDTAVNARLVDAIPGNSTLVSFTQDNGTAANCGYVGAGIECTWATLASGASATFSLTLRAGLEGTIVNTANVYTDSSDPQNTNNAATVTTTIIPSVDVSVQKMGPGNVTAGTNATYQITVANAGPSAANNVALTDVYPADTAFVSITQNTGPMFTCTTAPGLNCTIAALASGAQATFTLVLAVSPSAPPGILANTASVTTTSNDVGPPANNASTTTAAIAPSADVSISKTGPMSVVAGTTATYTIVVANAGPSDATTVAFTDTVPAGTTFASLTAPAGYTCTTPAAGGTGTITCNRAALPAGASTTFTLVLNVLPGTVNAITNTANVTAATADGNANNNTSSATTNVTASGDLAVTKTGPANIDGGTDITWTITVVNNGPSNAAGVTLSDTLPAGTTFVSLAQAGPAYACTTPAVGATGTITCTVASLAPASPTTFTLRANVAVDATSPVANTATVTSTSTDANNGNNSATASSTVVRADVSVVKTGPTGVAPGAPLTYQLAVSNAGPSAAANVVLTDVLPATTTFASITSNAVVNCTTPAVGANGTVTCTIASLASGATQTFALTVNTSPAAAGTVSNTATVAATTPDASQANNASTLVVPYGPTADLAITKTGPATVSAGSTVSYTITVVNNGPSVAAAVALNDPLPAQTTFASLTQGAGPAFTCTTPAVGGTGTVNCTIATLAPAAPATFTLVLNVAPAATGTVVNTVSIGAMTGDSNTNNNTAMATSAVGTVADLSITKTGPPNVTAGQSATYTIVVSNAGPAAAASVVMTDTLPANTTFASLTQANGPPFTCNTPPVGQAGTVTCNAATLANGASASFQLVVNVSPNATAAIINSASVSSASMDPTPANGAAAAAAALLLAPTDVEVTKTAVFDPLATTRTITWTITVRNLGPGVANNVVVSDPLQAGLTLNSVTPSQGMCAGNPAITCAIGVLAPGASATITLVTTITSNETAAGNTATATTDNPDANAANNAATAFARFAPRLIPTLGWQGLLALALLLGLAGAFGARRARTRH